MKKIILLILGISLLAYSAHAVIVGISGVPSGNGASCPADGSPDFTQDCATADVFTCNSTTNSKYAGILYNHSEGKEVCKIGWELLKYGTDISGHTFTCEIRNTDGDNLGAVITNGTSTGVAGSNDWAATWVYFTFPTPPTLAASTDYYIVLTSDTCDAASYARSYYSDEVADRCDNLYRWQSDLTNVTKYIDYEWSIKVFYYD